MRIPERLEPLVHAHLIDEVVGQLQSGKEAEVYVVRCGDEYRCAKVYKAVNDRTFKAKAAYTEGRKVRNSRQARAMEKSTSRYGMREREAEWQNKEVEALYLLSEAGVRVPKPYEFYEGVLLLQMIVDAEGNAAPRLNDVQLTPEEAKTHHATLMAEVVRMMSVGIVHGDLSAFNVLVAHDGLVIIDLPQAVQATANNAFHFLERDLQQLGSYFGRVVPEILETKYAKEIWKLHQSGKLRADSQLTGKFAESTKKADVAGTLAEIDGAYEDALEKRGPRVRR